MTSKSQENILYRISENEVMQVLNRKVLVTGVGGFIGSALASKLIGQGVEVLGVDDFSLGHERNVPKGLTFIRGDLSNERFVSELQSYDFDCIFHLAGQSGGELSFTEPVYDLEANTKSTLLLLDMMTKTGCRNLIYASSVAVYGDVAFSDHGLVESQNLHPSSPYGVSKLASEEYLKVFSEQHGLSTTTLRLFNTYGHGQDLSRMNQGMLSIFLGQALKTGRVVVKGSLDRFRDFVHVSDVVEAFLTFQVGMTRGNKIFNVSSGARTTVRQALDMLQREFEGKLEILVDGTTPGDVVGWLGNSDKLVKETNWRPKVGIEAGYSQMISDSKRAQGYVTPL